MEIKNYAIIEHLIIHFDEKLNIITGETGAGKSILLGALGLTLGERADSKALYNKEQKCFVEATFSLQNQKLKHFFKQNDLDFESEVNVRREIAVSGKSRAFINDTPVNLSTLKTLTSQLVNLHSQHETGLLHQQGFQINVLDIVAKNGKLLSQYQEALNQYKKKQKELQAIEENASALQQDYDFNLFQLTEIKEADLEDEVLEDLESELEILNNAEDIKTNLWEIVEGLDNENISALGILNELSSKLNSLASFGENLNQLNQRLESVLAELQDIRNETENLAENTSLDQERMEIVSEKVNTANRLLQKHQLHSIEELMVLGQALEQKTQSVVGIDQNIDALKEELQAQETHLNSLCQQLSEKRQKANHSVSKKISQTLQKIGMPNAIFEVKQNQKNTFDRFGKDEVQFYFSSNKGFATQELSKIASGGELSRVMLAIKYLLAGNTDLPTLIFDEIDTGISGEVAAKVGDVFTAISQKHQLISITHLPQIAAKANRHFFIYKENKSEKTKTKVAKLNAEQHIRAIAKMLSGSEISEASLENARLLVQG